MSSLVNLTAVTTTLQGFQLTSQTDMLTALTYLNAMGYTGVINCQSINATLKWSLGLYDTKQNTSQTGYVNDVIVIKNNTVATIIPAADFNALYTVAT